MIHFGSRTENLIPEARVLYGEFPISIKFYRKITFRIYIWDGYGKDILFKSFLFLGYLKNESTDFAFYFVHLSITGETINILFWKWLHDVRKLKWRWKRGLFTYSLSICISHILGYFMERFTSKYSAL